MEKNIHKRKQGGRKEAKGHVSNDLQKQNGDKACEEETTSLENEITSIDISELKRKLSRKRGFCSALEKEKTMYKILYKEEVDIKEKCIKLLNSTYEEYFAEKIILEEEAKGMEHCYHELLQEKVFCEAAKCRVDILAESKKKLEKKLFAAQKSKEEIPCLKEKLINLYQKVNLQDENIKNQKNSLNSEYQAFCERLEDDMNQVTKELINDDNLKLNLLPLSYKALFISGMAADSWLKTTLECIKSLSEKNIFLRKSLEELSLRKSLIMEGLKNFLSQIDVSLETKELLDNSLKERSLLKNNKFGNDILKQQHIQIENLKKMIENENKKLELLLTDLEKEEIEIRLQEKYLHENMFDIGFSKLMNTAIHIIKKEVEAY